jgi:3-methyladenine DNA glycosylase AlkD
MNANHQEIIDGIESLVKKNNIPLEKDGLRYIGTTKPVYFIRTADIRRMYKEFTSRHPDMTVSELVELLDSLSLARTYNEYSAIGLLLEAYPGLRATIDPRCLEGWLEHAEGWAEVDVICQLNFTAREMLANWDAWSSLLARFTGSENIHKRRASLVLLTKPLRESADPRLSQAAFANVEALKGEKHILITKAVSWILRSLIKHHREEVEQYLAENAPTLPKVAVREVRNKLQTGKRGG